MTYLVSILIPAYNAANWLGQTIESALNQTWPKKEIIIVDDGSSDETLAVAKRYESKTVKVVSQENSGACATRNGAYSLAQGHFIQWLDADDVLDKEKISEQMNSLGEDEQKKVLLTSSWASFYWCTSRAKCKADGLWETLEPAEWLLRKFRDDLWMNPACWLVSRELSDAAGPWDERLVRDNDGEYLCRLVTVASQVRFCSSARAYYRVGDLATLSNATSVKAANSRLLATQLCVGHLLSLEDSERTRLAAQTFLQRRAARFWPEFPELFEQLKTFASSLGVAVEEPKDRSLFRATRNFLGLKMAIRVQRRKRIVTTTLLRSFDALLHRAGVD